MDTSTLVVAALGGAVVALGFWIVPRLSPSRLPKKRDAATYGPALSEKLVTADDYKVQNTDTRCSQPASVSQRSSPGCCV